MPIGWLALLLLLPAQVRLPAPDGRTAWLEGQAAPAAAWEVEVQPAAKGWAWVELDGPDAGPDLDVVIEPTRADGERRRATSHRSDEAILVALDPATPLLVRVSAAQATDGPVAFRLGLTPLAPELTLEAGQPCRGVLDPEGDTAPRLQLLGLGALDWAATELHALRLEGQGDVDFVVLDGRADTIALALADGAEDRCRPEAPPADAAPEDLPRFALVWARGGPITYELRGDGPPRDEKAFAPTRLERFLQELASTPEQRRALEALRRTPDFVRIRHYVEAFPGGLPLRLRAVPGLRAGGVERFGTYGRGTLTINPTIPAHRENVQELLDTLVHELVHALLDLRRGPRFPFGPDVLDAEHDPRLEAVADLPIRRGSLKGPVGRYLDEQYGPSASDPERDYSDINAGAQRLIVKIIEETMRRTDLGHETIVFEHVRARLR